MPLNRTVGLMLLVGAIVAGCGDAEPDDDPRVDAGIDTAADPDTDTGTDADARAGADRSDTRTDTVLIEGMAEPITLRLFRTPAGFPLPFSAYLPDDMAAAVDPDERTARFTAEFGGARNDDAYMALVVFPAGTTRAEALAAARSYETGRGLPAGGDLDPVADTVVAPDLVWASDGYRFRYESDDERYAGSLGVGRRGDRFFMIVRHHPVEYGDGFGPRAHLITETWRWADGTPLHGTRAGRAR